MTVNLTDLKKAKNKLEEDIKGLLYRFEKTNSFIVTDIKINRHPLVIENTHFKKNVLYDVKTNITL